MKELGIDIETYSDRDLKACGVYKYAESPTFTILLFSYSVDRGEVVCCDFANGETLPEEVLSALKDPRVTKTAFNAMFERVCISRYFGWDLLDPAQWKCTMVRAARMGFPLSLGQCAEVLGLEEKKMAEGTALIRFFSCPYRGVRRLPKDAPEKWELFKKYNIRDVEVEQAILAKVARLETPAFDEILYELDQRINDRGVMLDTVMAANASKFTEGHNTNLLNEAKQISGLDNPNSPAQIKSYLKEHTAISIDTINKKSLEELESRLDYFPKAKKLLAIRKELGKTSNKKYDAMLNCVCDDSRIHGLLQFYGASRTGRWAGRLVQIHNLPQNHLPDIDYARSLVRAGDFDEYTMNYPNPSQTLSELIRTTFIADEGKMLFVCDFSAIEARVIAWLAGEKWVIDVFREGGDIYCATASRMFKVPVEKHGRNSELRAKGKIAVLALGYGGGVSALEAMGGSRMGLSEAEERDIVNQWRNANPCIVRLWSIVEKAAIRAIQSGEEIPINRGIRISFKWGMLLIKLPSGRYLCYPRAEVIEDEDSFGRMKHSITYEGIDQTTKKWGTQRTYGGKLTENIIQALARDILGVTIIRAEESGFPVVFHVHDEIIAEVEEVRNLSELERLFSMPIEWCPDLPLRGEGFKTKYYLKD